MRLLLVAATPGEVQPITARFSDSQPQSPHLSRFQYQQHGIDVLVTGVGMVATAALCARTMSETKPDLAINVGLCGTFKAAFPPGSVVHVVSDCIPELGAENGEQFLTLHDLGLQERDAPPYRDGRLVNTAAPSLPALAQLPAVRGITVNTVHGHEPSIARVIERWSPDVESMEGAAFMFSALVAGVPFAQVRAVSNVVERRNRESWRIIEAMSNLTSCTVRILDDL